MIMVPPTTPRTTPEEEAGIVTFSHIQPRVGVAFLATLKDPDERHTLPIMAVEHQ